MATTSNIGDASTDFGLDFDFLSDLNPQMDLVGGFTNLGQALAHRLETPRGSLFYDLDYGTDIRDMLEESIDSNALASVQSSVQKECIKDERIISILCAAAYDLSSDTLTLQINATSSAGPFQLVLSVSALSVTLLEPPVPLPS